MKEIQRSYEESSEQKREAEEIREYLHKENAKTADKREAIEKELEDVWPIVEAAKKQVKGIKKTDISELKSYKEPNPAVLDVFDALFRLMGKGKVSWSAIKKEMTSATFLDSVTGMDARSITSKDRENVKKFIKKNSGSFDKKAIYRVSRAAGPLAEFTLALVRLADTYENIAPLEEAMAEVDRKLASSKKKLEEKDAELKKIDEKVAVLKKSYAKKTGESETLKMKVTEAEDRIKKATVLLNKLLEEKSRWEKGVNGI